MLRQKEKLGIIFLFCIHIKFSLNYKYLTQLPVTFGYLSEDTDLLEHELSKVLNFFST